jgi:hypothetical protein
LGENHVRICLPSLAVIDREGPGWRERRAVAASNLRIDAATAEVLGALEAADVEALLLKGATIARWLYDGTRGYTDSDLWVRPGDVDGAERILRSLSFEESVDRTGLPDWWQEHGSEWTRSLDGVCVDLHRTLPGLGVDPELAWRTLSARSETVPVAGYPARALGRSGRALHLALHAAQHGEAWGRVLADLEHALEVVDQSVWKEAAALAAELGAIDGLGAGLRLVPAGAALAGRLQLPANRSVEVALHASSPPPIALGFDQLARAGKTRARVRIVVRKVVPPPGFMRHWYPPAAQSRRRLVVAYLYRPIWLLRNAPPGWRAWRAARRRVRARAD